MKTYKPILFVLLFAIAGVTLFIWSSWLDKKRAEESQHWVSHTNSVLKELDCIRILALYRESSVRGYMATGNPVFLDSLATQSKAIKTNIEEATRLLIDNSHQLDRLRQVTKLMEEKSALQEQAIEVRRTNSPELPKLLSGLKGKTLMDEASAILAAMNVEENRLLQERTAQYHETGRKSFKTSVIGALAVLIFTAILLLRLNKDILLRRKAEEEVQKSEAKYRQFVENAGVINYTADANGNFTFISKQVESLIGFSPEELMGKHFSVLVQPAWLVTVADKYKEQFTSRQRESTLLFPISHKNGETLWVQQDAILLEKDNLVTGFQCVVKDVTEQTLTQQKLQKIEEEQKEYQYRAQAILDNAPLVIYVKDLEGKFILINRMFRELFGFTDEDVIGKDSFGFAHQTTPTLKRYTEADRQVIETLKPVEMEDVMVVADGHRNLLSIKFPLFDKNNKLLGVSGFMKDVTDMAKYRQELIAARQKAESAETLQEQFLANMSHEIRTPMNGIVGMTGLLMQTPLQENQQEYVQIIKQSSDNLLVLINDILDLSKIKAGKISIEKIPFSLDDVIKPLNAAFRLKAAEKELGFSILLHPSVPAYLLGDPHRLGQVLSNLLSNAMKFTEKGYVTLEISMQDPVDKKQPTLSFLVSDSGIGIDAKQLPLIFESFSQASSDTTRRFGGTGLGLAITKRLVELQHGSIHVASKSGSGTTFTVLLPFAISAETEVMKGKVKPAIQPDIVQDFAGKHVLIVEDNEVNQRVLKYNLEQYNLAVTITGNGKEAIQWLRNNHTDLIMMDLHMPYMDGLQATDYIRRQMRSTIPIVILTASVLRNERQRCLSIGANDYIAKPFAREELQRSLERFLLHRDLMPSDHQPSLVSHADGNPVYDLSALLQLKDPTAIKAIYEVFESTVPSGLEELKQLAIKEDWEGVFELSHKLKSSLGIIQVKDLLSKMAAIEMNARTHKELREILPAINESIATFYHVAPMIKLEIEKETV
jgi:PAS domain S-box-containing protein